MGEPWLRIRPYEGARYRFRRHDAACVRVARAVGALIRHEAPMLHVAHVGSTAVPLCRGTGVVDLAVCYPPGALAAALDVIDALGFQRQTPGDPFPGPPPMRLGAVRWNARLYDLHVRVIERDTAEHRELIAWRERLRREPALRLAYEAEKRLFLQGGEGAERRSAIDYARLKDAFIPDTLATPPAWAGNGPRLRRMLLAWGRADLILGDRLARTGERSGGYAEALEQTRNDNADRLVALLDALGRWPGQSLVGEDATAAAWHIAQHAVSRPAVQRRCLALLADAAERDEADRRHAALLTDRIRFNEGRPQAYGTVFDWDGDGRPGPGELEAAESVEERRAAVGLPPLAEELERVRREVEREGVRPPADLAAHRERHAAWARVVGWREDEP